MAPGGAFLPQSELPVGKGHVVVYHENVFLPGEGEIVRRLPEGPAAEVHIGQRLEEQQFFPVPEMGPGHGGKLHPRGAAGIPARKVIHHEPSRVVP
ncbi:hypothetical protein SDC9_69941 [bioreactor metagenome]|uniref:Uncharacterized protein n=1 Tax=bioreactor metagenome TaxID=1076179 RepID=A0A644Y699_9ZZZZ